MFPPLLALFALLLPQAVFAQTPATRDKANGATALTLDPPQVSLKVALVTASIADIDNLGINYDIVPFTVPAASPSAGASAPATGKMYLEIGTGELIQQLYLTLSRSHSNLIYAPTVTTPIHVAATITLETQVPYFTSAARMSNMPSQPPHPAGFLRVRGKITIIPHVSPEGMITLDLQPLVSTAEDTPPVISPAVADSVPFLLRTIPSGDTLVILGPFTEAEKQGAAFEDSIFHTLGKSVNNQELLVFITPALLGKDGKAIPFQPVTVIP